MIDYVADTESYSRHVLSFHCWVQWYLFKWHFANTLSEWPTSLFALWTIKTFLLYPYIQQYGLDYIYNDWFLR